MQNFYEILLDTLSSYDMSNIAKV